MSLRPFLRKHCRAEENILSTLLLVGINLRNVIEGRGDKKPREPLFLSVLYE
tara:strand:- start:284 stop:439 length:156 start_codon:yes stop_codon:yes gene_type:complete